jgi:hypothetical protein
VPSLGTEQTLPAHWQQSFGPSVGVNVGIRVGVRVGVLATHRPEGAQAAS